MPPPQFVVPRTPTLSTPSADWGQSSPASTSSLTPTASVPMRPSPRGTRVPLYPKARSTDTQSVPLILRTPSTPQSASLLSPPPPPTRERTGMSPAFTRMNLGTRSLSPPEDPAVQSRFSPPASRTTPSHRRAHSLPTIAPSYGYMIYPPHARPVKLVTPTHHARSKGSARLVLVPRSIAAHLARGGSVSIRTVDGSKRWKASMSPTLPNEGPLNQAPIPLHVASPMTPGLKSSAVIKPAH